MAKWYCMSRQICICRYTGKRMKEAYVCCYCMKYDNKEKCIWDESDMSICVYVCIWISEYMYVSEYMSNVCIWIFEVYGNGNLDTW